MQPAKVKPVIVAFLGDKAQALHPAAPIDFRQARVDEFLTARTLAPKTQKAYRQDLTVFMQWSEVGWEALTARQVAQFKEYLLRVEAGKRVYKDTSVARILGTLKNFYGWLNRSHYIKLDPTTEVSLPKLPEPEARNLSAARFHLILEAIQATSLPERNLAIVALLSQGLRPSEPCSLDIKDFDGERVQIRQAKAGSTGSVPLSKAACAAVQAYLGWRLLQGETLTPETPLLVSHSHRNQGQRLTYDTIHKLMTQLKALAGFDFQAHQFRHTFATNLVLEGMSPYHVQTLTRHKDQRSFRRYTKAADYAAAENAYRELEKRSP